MTLKILKICECGRYTLNSTRCPQCKSSNLRSPHPPKFSLEDKYGEYRRQHLQATGVYPRPSGQGDDA